MEDKHLKWEATEKSSYTLRKSTSDVVDLMSEKIHWIFSAYSLKYKRNRVLSASERNELRSLYLQPPNILQTFGASLILIFIEY